MSINEEFNICSERNEEFIILTSAEGGESRNNAKHNKQKQLTENSICAERLIVYFFDLAILAYFKNQSYNLECDINYRSYQIE